MENATVNGGICGESFNSEHELRKHQQTVHAAEVNNRRRSRDNESDGKS